MPPFGFGRRTRALPRNCNVGGGRCPQTLTTPLPPHMNSTASATAQWSPPAAPHSRPHLDEKFNPATVVIFVGALGLGLLYAGYSLFSDVQSAGAAPATTYVPYILLV